MTIRALIIDDEFHARRRIRKLSEKIPECLILGEARNGTEAVSMINDLNPDLLFLDIQMPGLSGFDVLKSLDTDKRPYIIFTTAYNQYAVDAFDVQATDYLLKPFDEDRFNEAFSRVKEFIRHKEAFKLEGELKKLFTRLDSEKESQSMIFEIERKGYKKEVDFMEVMWIEAQGNYIKLNLHDSNYLLRETMSNLEKKLSQVPALRIHRSILVNTTYIKKIHYLNNNEYLFELTSGEKLKSGRSYKAAIARHLEKSDR